MKITASMVKTLRERTDAPMMACKKALQETDGDIEQAIENLRKAGEVKAAKRAAKTAADGKTQIAISEDGKIGFMVDINCETDFVARDQFFRQFVQEVAEAGLLHQAADVETLLDVKVDGETIEKKRQDLVSKLGENVQIRRVALVESKGVVNGYCHGDRIAVLVALDKEQPELTKDIAMHVAATNPQAITSDQVSETLITKEREIFAAQAKESGKPDNIIEKMIVGRINKFLKEISLVDQPFVKNPDQTIGQLLAEHNAAVNTFIRFEVGEGITRERQNFADEVMSQVEGN